MLRQIYEIFLFRPNEKRFFLNKKGKREMKELNVQMNFAIKARVERAREPTIPST